jgi:hypothetical protein
MRRFTMKTLLFSMTSLGIAVPSLANAQVKIDMTRVTCADYLAMPPDQVHLTSAWMSGWFNQKRGYVWVDLGDYEAHIGEVHQFCASHPEDQLMGVIEHIVTKK